MKKLLIVDDETGIVDEVKGFFEEEGFSVATADTAKEGMDALDRDQPDLMMLDMKLPDMSGLAVLKYVKEKYPKVKVIVNTGYVDQAVIDEAEKLGRDAFLQKPFNLERLMEEVTNLIGDSPAS